MPISVYPSWYFRKLHLTCALRHPPNASGRLFGNWPDDWCLLITPNFLSCLFGLSRTLPTGSVKSLDLKEFGLHEIRPRTRTTSNHSAFACVRKQHVTDPTTERLPTLDPSVTHLNLQSESMAITRIS